MSATRTARGLAAGTPWPAGATKLLLKRVCGEVAVAVSRSVPSVRLPPFCLPLQGTHGGRQASRMLWVLAFPVLPGEGPWPSPWAMARAEPPPALLSGQAAVGLTAPGPHGACRCA